jgi:hypothetical protein
VLSKLAANNPFIKPEKCHFKQSEVEFLGLIVGKDSIKINPAKVEGVTKWPVPSKVKHIQAFLGLANFYQQFIQNFAKIVQPLTLLTCKDVPWRWTDECQSAFDMLKKAFTTAPILQIPNNLEPYQLKTNSLDFATSVVLEHKGKDSLWHPVAFYSKSLNEHEQNYAIYDKELLAII